MALNYSFFSDQGETPQTLQERRLRADMLAGQIGQGNTYGSGIGDLFKGIGAGLSRYRTNKMQKAGDAGAKSGMDQLMELMYANPANQSMQTGFDGTASQGGVPQVPQLATYTPPQPQTQQQPPMPAGGLVQQVPQMSAQPIPEPAGPMGMAPAQQASAAQMQPAGNDAALVPQIREVLRNPFISDQDRAFLRQRLDDIQKKQDPMYQVGLEKSQLELDALRNPGPKYDHVGDTIVEMTPEGPKVVYKDENNPANNVIEDIDGRSVLLNKNTGQIIKDLGQSPIKQQTVPQGYEENPDGSISRRKGYRDTNLEMDMRKEFDAQSKDFRSVRDSYNRIQASAENPSPAGDLSLIFNYMKMLDPSSVVRETEFATAAAAGSFGERIQGAVSQVTNGQRLAPEMRADFLNRAEQLYGEQDQTFQSLADQYSAAAERNGLDPQNIILTPRSNPRKPGKTGLPAGWTQEEFDVLTPAEKKELMSP